MTSSDFQLAAAAIVVMALVSVHFLARTPPAGAIERSSATVSMEPASVPRPRQVDEPSSTSERLSPEESREREREQ